MSATMRLPTCAISTAWPKVATPLAVNTSSAARAIGISMSAFRSTKISLMIGLMSWVKAAALPAITAMQIRAPPMRQRCLRR